ncbi:hypothetical protein PIB30_090386, partial [Stylosanthes scabra]|nr:hypothetical protein [Stylosanthes scabra]
VSSFRRVFEMERPPTSEAEDFDGPDESNGAVVSADVILLELLVEFSSYARAAEVEAGHTVDDRAGIGDPIAVRTKGTGRGNERVGSRGVKKRKGSACGELGHRRTLCTKYTGVVKNGTQESLGAFVSLSQTHRVKRSHPNRANGVTNLDDSISQGDAHSEGLDGPLTDGYGGPLTDQGQDQSPSF